MRIVSRVGIGKNPTSHHLDVTGSANFDSQVFFQNTAFFNAGVELGDTASDLISVNGRIDTNIEPSVTLTNDLGSSSLFWNNFYTKNLYIKNAGSIESDGNVLNLGTVSAITINVGTSSSIQNINIGSSVGTTTINSPNSIVIGDLEIRGGDLITNQTTFNLINTVATTLNIGGAASSTINIGSSSSLTNVPIINIAQKATIQSLILGFRAVTSAAIINDNDHIISASGASDYTVTLPSAATNTGRVYIIKSNMNSGVILTVNTTSSQTIDGLTSISLHKYDAIHVVSNGNNWQII
jgi:hypothetical protein